MALSRRVVAGGNLFAAWTVEDTGTVGIGTTPLYKLANNIISTDVTRDAASGAYSVSIEHVEDTEALQTFINAATNFGAGAIEDLLLEDGVSETGAAQNKKLIVAVRGGLVGGVADVVVDVGIVVVVAVGVDVPVGGVLDVVVVVGGGVVVGVVDVVGVVVVFVVVVILGDVIIGVCACMCVCV